MAQKRLAKELGFSYEKIQKLYKLPPTNQRRNQMLSKGPKKHQMFSKEPVIGSAKSIMNKKSKLKSGDKNDFPIHGKVHNEQVFS